VSQGLALPENPSEQQLKVLQAYLKDQEKSASTSSYGKQNHYQDKKVLIEKKLIIYRHSQKKNTWYMRFYVGDKKYKVLSLRTDQESVATERALEKWRHLQGHIEGGGKVFTTTTQESINEYVAYLEDLVETEQMKKHTLQAKKTSIKKLRKYLEAYEKTSDIPALVLDGYITWRRTKNWDKKHHKNNPRPPSDLTVNKELCDFKGFFNWCTKKKKYVRDIEYPFLKIDWNKSIEKNPAFTVEDWRLIVFYLRTWINKKENSRGELRKNFFYRKVFSEFLKVLANSGLRVHECLLLRWSDISLKSRVEKSESGKNKDRERIIAHIEVAPETKTGRRLVICPAGIYLKRIRQIYTEAEGRVPARDEYIFRNIGTVNSRADHFVGQALSSTFFRKLWYELLEDIRVDKDTIFNNTYTLYSCRSFFINQRLEIGVAPALVAELVGHSIKTMERYYKNIRLRQVEPELVEVRRKKLSEAEFKTYDLDYRD